MAVNTLEGVIIYLRALEPEDIELLYAVENDESLWHLSETKTPFSRSHLKNYLSNSHLPIEKIGQLRLAICDSDTQKVIGFVDLFDYDVINGRAGVGIVIAEADKRNKGFGKEALQILSRFGKERLQLHQLYANIAADNASSIALFTAVGFEQTGTKKSWLRKGSSYVNVQFFQLIL